MYYFAYGSNLKIAQMKTRCPNAIPLERAYLPNFKLEFRKNVNQSSVATIAPSKGGYIEGAIYKVTQECLHSLNRYEGYPTVYYRALVTVFTYQHLEVEAFTYLMLHKRPYALPLSEYLERITDGYNDFSIPLESLVYSLRECVGDKAGEWLQILGAK